jgi:hypothetical protein
LTAASSNGNPGLPIVRAVSKASAINSAREDFVFRGLFNQAVASSVGLGSPRLPEVAIIEASDKVLFLWR